MNYTIFGASGSIGGALRSALLNRDIRAYCPQRCEVISDRDLGVVFYCIGLPAEYRQRPLDAVEAHVGLLNRILQTANFKRMIYLSSTKVYAGLEGVVDEETALRVNPLSLADLYVLSKLTGEASCFHSGREAVSVRLSSVIGSKNVVLDLIDEACVKQNILLRSAPETSKDYILLEDVVESLLALAGLPDPEPIYNIASGYSLSNAQVCEVICKALGCKYSCAASSPVVGFPRISISKAQKDLNLTPGPLLEAIAKIARIRAKESLIHL